MMLSKDQQHVHIPIEAKSWAVEGGWKRLDDLCNGIFDCPHTTPEITISGPYVVRSQDIRTGVFILPEAGHVSNETYRERIARAEPRFGDLLYSREGTYFGIAAEVPPGINVCLGQRMVLIRPEPQQLNSKFLRYWLNSPVMARHIEGFRDGSVAERLNMPVIRGLPVPVFSRDVQAAIAIVLSALDDKIALNQDMNLTLEAMARAMFKDWFVDFGPTRAKLESRHPYLAADIWSHFPDRFDAKGMPQGWSNSMLGAHIIITKGKSYRSEELQPSKTALVTLKSFERGGGYRRDGLKGYVGSYKAEQVVNEREIVVAQTDVTQAAEVIGRPARVIADRRYETLVASLDVAVVRPHEATYLGQEFLHGLMRTDSFTQHTFAHSTGTTVLHLSKQALPSFEFVLPPLELIKAFEEATSTLTDRVIRNVHENDNLISLRELLLPKLMSGEMGVKDAEKLVGRAA